MSAGGLAREGRVVVALGRRALSVQFRRAQVLMRQRGYPRREGVLISATTVKKRVVERYIEGSRAGDHEMILGCLTDDVTWEMPPYFALSGRTAFDRAIEKDASPGLPDIQLTRLIEEEDVVVAEGGVQATLKDGGRIDALFCDVFHFREDKICRLVTYQVDRRAGDQTRRAFDA